MVSATHAEFRWNGSTWELRDLDSRNGTFVDGRQLGSGERHLLMRGSRLAFGDPDNVYELVSDDPPWPSATSADGERREARDGPLLLPDADDPAYFVFQEGSDWYVESPDGDSNPVATGATLQTGDVLWRLDLPIVTEQTRTFGQSPLALDNLTLRFTVSRDEEHVDLDLVADDGCVRLPPRIYWYTLLTLARKYQKDRDKDGLHPDEAGWMYVADLLTQLQMEQNALYQHICRAKRDLSRVKVVGYGKLFERRTSTRQIRLRAKAFEIVG